MHGGEQRHTPAAQRLGLGLRHPTPDPNPSPDPNRNANPNPAPDLQSAQTPQPSCCAVRAGSARTPPRWSGLGIGFRV